MRHASTKSIPFVTLRQAIDRTSSLFRESPAVPIAMDDAMARLGYEKDCAIGRRLIGTLVAYGLAMKDAQGKLALTALARRILQPANEFDRDTALVDAATLPPLFRAAHDHFDNRPLDREELSHWLRRHGVEKSAVEDAAYVYCKTAAFVSESRQRIDQVIAALAERQGDMPGQAVEGRRSRTLEATDLAWE